jgi:hypothetical protein
MIIVLNDFGFSSLGLKEADFLNRLHYSIKDILPYA